ncbi:g13347 [Coccomyxa viridis]|uniref:G13347 protein n=1 Tax=Coccomyxa viridis TaxID=1274662 RepID=A0ABP1GF49_9CHLO
MSDATKGHYPGVLAGSTSARSAVEEVIGWPLLYESEGCSLGIDWPKGLLIHGPAGCGKTALVHSVAEQYGVLVRTVTPATVYGAYTGESEKRLREAFEEAREQANRQQPTIIFLDELDSLAPVRSTQQPHEARVVAQLLTLLDGAATQAGPGYHLRVIAATSRPTAIDPALRRVGRLDSEVAVNLPTPEEREDILRLHARGLPLGPDVDLASMAKSCHGYSGADLAAVCREAAMRAISKAVQHASDEHSEEFKQCNYSADVATVADSLKVSSDDFGAALQRVPPSLTRGMQIVSETVTWSDVGGYDDVKSRLRQALEWPLKHTAAFKRLGLLAPRGILLYGPPGCSKTRMAQAAAGGSGMRLQPLSGAQLFSMYVGEGEALLRDAFQRARLTAPAIIFIDEIDAIVGGRASQSSGAHGGQDASARLLSTLLTEMDGLESATGVVVLAATNRADMLDAALMRPGRFDVQLHVPLPDLASRKAILEVHTRGMPLDPTVDLQALAECTQGYSGADLHNLCQEAALTAARQDQHAASHVAMKHFEAALLHLQPSVQGSVRHMTLGR